MPKRPRHGDDDDYSQGGDDSGDEDYVLENDVQDDDFKISRDDGVGAAARRRKKGQFSKVGSGHALTHASHSRRAYLYCCSYYTYLRAGFKRRPTSTTL